jgi:Spy/CpxP family protein refolding chaperone
MRRRILLAVVLSVAVVTMGAAAPPEGSGVASWSRFPLANTPLARTISGCIGRLMVLRSELNVTAQQQAQIRDVLKSHRSQIAVTVQSVREKRTALRDAVLSGKADEAQIRTAANELGSAIADAAVKASKLRNEIAPILTEDQRHMIGKFLKDNDAAVDKFLENAAEAK